jgi:hypothetical protein
VVGNPERLELSHPYWFSLECGARDGRGCSSKVFPPLTAASLLPLVNHCGLSQVWQIIGLICIDIFLRGPTVDLFMVRLNPVLSVSLYFCMHYVAVPSSGR